MPKQRAPQPSSHQRGYDTRYRRLRNKAVRLQPWCTTCGHTGDKTNPLTLDHTPAAWVKAPSLTVKDIADGMLTVECLRCNIAKGPARGPNTRPQN
jgi:5-methylcytosine-specific restriction protein A